MINLLKIIDVRVPAKILDVAAIINTLVIGADKYLDLQLINNIGATFFFWSGGILTTTWLVIRLLNALSVRKKLLKENKETNTDD